MPLGASSSACGKQAARGSHSGCGTDSVPFGRGTHARGEWLRGASMPPALLDVERRTAAAGARHVGVPELEAGPVGALDVVDLGPVQVLVAQRIHEQRN